MRILIISCCILQQVCSMNSNVINDENESSNGQSNQNLRGFGMQMARPQQNIPLNQNYLTQNLELQPNADENDMQQCSICLDNVPTKMIRLGKCLYCTHKSGDKYVKHIIQCKWCFDTTPYRGLHGEHFSQCVCPKDRQKAKWTRPKSEEKDKWLDENLVNLSNAIVPMEDEDVAHTGNNGIATVQTVLFSLLTVLAWFQTEYKAKYSEGGEEYYHPESRPESIHAWMFQEATRDGITSMFAIAIFYMIHAWKRGDNLVPKPKNFLNSKFLISWLVVQFSTYIIGSASSPYVTIIFGIFFVLGVLLWQFLPDKRFRPLDSSMNHYLHLYPQGYSQSWFTFEGNYMLEQTKWQKLGRDALYVGTLMSFVSWIFALEYAPIRTAILPDVGVGLKYVFFIVIIVIWVGAVIIWLGFFLSGHCSGSCPFPDFSAFLYAVESTDWSNPSPTGAAMFWTYVFTFISGLAFLYSQIYYPLRKAKLPVLVFQRFLMTGAFSFMVYHASTKLMTYIFYGYLTPMGFLASYFLIWLFSFDCFCCCFGCGGCNKDQREDVWEDACVPFHCVPCSVAPCVVWAHFNKQREQQIQNAENNLLN